MSLRVAALLLAGIMPVPTQIIPCCCDSVHRYWIDAYLSPFIDAELVKPAAILSFHWPVNQALDEASANFLKSPDTPPI